MTIRLRARLVEWLPAAIVLVAVLGIWQGAIVAFHVQRFLLPKPSDIARTLWDDRSTLWQAGWYTLKEALGGFFGGSALGFLFAVAIARFRRIGAAFMPLAIAANAVPIIAFAPIANAWFGEVSPHSKMAIAGVLCFFPVMINTLRGLTSVRPRQIELMHAYAGGEFEIFRRVRIPTALPYIFTALKVASVLAMIGAIVGEWFGGSSENALGVLINSDAAIFDFTTAWAGIVVASLLGIGLYLIVVLAESVLVRWTPESRAA